MFDTAMSSVAVPIGVQAFIRKNIASIAELEALLLLWKIRQAWSAQDVAQHLYVSIESARETLEALRGCTLLDEVNGRYVFIIIPDIPPQWRTWLQPIGSTSS
jgi:hypothetical protein